MGLWVLQKRGRIQSNQAHGSSFILQKSGFKLSRSNALPSRQQESELVLQIVCAVARLTLSPALLGDPLHLLLQPGSRRLCIVYAICDVGHNYGALFFRLHIAAMCVHFCHASPCHAHVRLGSGVDQASQHGRICGGHRQKISQVRVHD
jgi:hypothetical protein